MLIEDKKEVSKLSKKLLFFALFICSSVLVMSMVSAADAHVFTDVNDARLLAIDNAGNTNATGWLAESGVKLSDTYCALTGCTFTGGLVMGAGQNITLGTGGYIISGGSAVDFSNVVNHTQITFDLYNATWDESGLIDELNTSLAGYVDTQDGIFNDSAAAYTIYVNTTAAAYTDAQIAAVGGMDYTNVALINISNTFTPQQIFSGGLSSAENVTLADTKLVEWVGGGSISSSSGVITYKAGV